MGSAGTRPWCQFLAAGLLLTLLLAAAPARSTSDHVYKKNEYLTVTDGRSPDGKYALATHGEGDGGYDNFHVYLMKQPGSKRIGTLDGIENYLGTAPDAWTARWSPDSRHVALFYRSSRRVITMRMYRVDAGGARIVSGATPLEAAGLTGGVSEYPDDPGQPELRLRGLELTWTGPRTFRIVEDGRAWLKPETAAAFARYGAVATNPDQTGAPETLHELVYAIEADGEVSAGGTFAITAPRPTRLPDHLAPVKDVKPQP